MQRPQNPFLANMGCCSFRDEQQEIGKSLVSRGRCPAATHNMLHEKSATSARKAFTSQARRASAALSSTTLPSNSGRCSAMPDEADNMRLYSSRSGMSQAPVEWERTQRQAGSAAVDVTNLFLNPQKPSVINMWQVRWRHPHTAHDRH